MLCPAHGRPKAVKRVTNRLTGEGKRTIGGNGDSDRASPHVLVAAMAGVWSRFPSTVAVRLKQPACLPVTSSNASPKVRQHTMLHRQTRHRKKPDNSIL